MESYNSQTEQKIIDAATEVFVQKGKDGARMQEIADRAGINKALLHYYFRSKNLLYQKVFETEIRGFFSELFDAFHQVDNGEKFIREFIDNYIDAISHRPEVVRFILWEIEQGGNSFHRIFQKMLSERGLSEFPLVLMIRNLIQSGQLRQMNPIHFMLSLIGMCAYPFIARPLLQKLLGIDTAAPEFLAVRKEEIFKQLWEGVKPL